MIKAILWEVVNIETLIVYLSDKYNDSPDVITSAIMAYNSSSFIRITKEVLDDYIDFEYDKLHGINKKDEEKIKFHNDRKEVYYHLLWAIIEKELPDDFLIHVLEF